MTRCLEGAVTLHYRGASWREFAREMLPHHTLLPPLRAGEGWGGVKQPRDRFSLCKMKESWTRARELRRASTDAERHLWRHLRHRNLAAYKFRRQFPIASYIVDFVCLPAMLVVQVDGGQHLDAQRYDKARTSTLEANGYRVLRFWNDEVLLQTEAVIEVIWRNLPVR